ncbi:MAG TPA: TIM44-like domain-containing protein [Pseudomonas sp.]|jgi:predicted lipid-binding transport protein (Tim44 family)|uniref:Tim44 domain-containing protein n=1 Tax=Denitrificimonas caeni TaxID=521720 RepID=UPI0003B6C433|nr:TIM44-like domain-containing protein [Denitrificimonas caeni]HHX05021.1 TIM44-like domain-containing protein [Pseudomonas sp.]
MQRFLSIALALCLGLTFSLDADAKRFGGGKSWGAKPKHSQMQKQQAQPAAGQTTGKQPATAGAKPGIGGMLMGMAAGGLLASMFMGGAFEGLQIMDILIFGLIAFVIFKLIASRRRQMPQAATAGGPAMQREAHNANQNIFGGSSAAARPVIQVPAWFNESSFLQAAEGHFNALQQHWDANEMHLIAEFVTPEMLTFLATERSSLGDAMQSTYIDDLTVQLDGLDEQSDLTVATITFHGIAKTSRFDQGEAFSESWRMERKNGDNQPWLIAGIRQNA